MSVYEKIRAYISKHELKTTTVAKKAGISDKTLDAILNGKQTLDSNDFRAICYALNVLPERFM